MKSYIVSIMCVSVIGALVSLLAPEGEGGGMSKHIRLVFGLCVVIVCINPMKNVLDYINSLDVNAIVEAPEQESDKYSEIFDGAYEAAETQNLKNGIKQLLYDRFKIDGAECAVSVAFTADRELSRIAVTLYGSAIWKNTNEIEDYLGSLFKCEIVTVIG